MNAKEFYTVVKKCREEFHAFAITKDRKNMDNYFKYAKQIDEEVERVENILAKQKEKS